MSDILPRWFAASTDRMMAIDGLIARAIEEDDEDEEEEEEEDKKDKDEDSEDEDDGYSE